MQETTVNRGAPTEHRGFLQRFFRGSYKRLKNYTKITKRDVRRIKFSVIEKILNSIRRLKLLIFLIEEN